MLLLIYLKHLWNYIVLIDLQSHLLLYLANILGNQKLMKFKYDSPALTFYSILKILEKCKLPGHSKHGVLIGKCENQLN